MRWKLETLIAAGLLVLPMTSGARADVIELRADPWCPFNCDPAAVQPGYMVEVAREALALAGHEVNYRTLSWARSLEETRSGVIDGVIGAVPEEAPDFVFGPPMGSFQETVAVRSGEAIDITAPDVFEGLRMGAINGYKYYGAISDYLEANRDNRDLVQFTYGDDALEKNLRKLVVGRVDVVAEVSSVLSYKLDELGLEGEVEVIKAPDMEDIYIAFSPVLESSKRYARDLHQGVETLRASGRLKAIMASYALPIWE